MITTRHRADRRVQPEAAADAQLARDIGVDRSTSSRPSVSSEAQPFTSVAAAKPGEDQPERDERELEERPGARQQVDAAGTRP